MSATSEVTTSAYGRVSLAGLELALFEAVADETGFSVEEVAERLLGLHGVPSDYLYAAWDNEVSALCDRVNEEV